MTIEYDKLDGDVINFTDGQVIKTFDFTKE